MLVTLNPLHVCRRCFHSLGGDLLCSTAYGPRFTVGATTWDGTSLFLLRVRHDSIHPRSYPLPACQNWRHDEWTNFAKCCELPRISEQPWGHATSVVHQLSSATETRRECCAQQPLDAGFPANAESPTGWQQHRLFFFVTLLRVVGVL